MDFDVLSPRTDKELLDAINRCQDKKFRYGAGYTDLINELNVKPEDGLTVINLAQLKDVKFRSLSFSEEGLTIGALVTASEIVNNNEIKSRYPVFWEAANSVASMQIRAAATVAGNICQASPAGDMSCALVALHAKCEIIDSNGIVREEKLSDFFKGVRKTSLRKNEILRSIFVPKNIHPVIKSGYVKIGSRMSMEICIVSLAYHIQADINNVISEAGIAIGAVAPVIKFTQDAARFLAGKDIETISEQDIHNFACLVKAHANPISDVRASAWYRTEVLFNSAKTIFGK